MKGKSWRTVLKFQADAADGLETKFRWPLLGIFFLAGALFLWAPTRWVADSFRRFFTLKEDGTALPRPGEGEVPAPPGNPPPAEELRLAEPARAAEPPAEKIPRPVVFRFLAPAAREVFLGGNFNNYNARKNPLSRRPDGVWETTLALAPGRYDYKFKVDGRWELDPTNPDKTPQPRVSSRLEIK